MIFGTRSYLIIFICYCSKPPMGWPDKYDYSRPKLVKEPWRGSNWTAQISYENSKTGSQNRKEHQSLDALF
jgi:hypothetical protein